MTESKTTTAPSLDEIHDALRTKYWSWTTLTSAPGSPTSLLALLTRELPHIPRDSWPQRFAFGGIYINGREALGDQALPFPHRVEYYEPKFPIESADAVFPEFKSDYVVYRDNDILVAYKPPGLSSMPAKEQRHYSMKAALETVVGGTIHMPSRLDVSAQGLLITSISRRAHPRLQQAFESRLVTKRYLCASTTRAPWSTIQVSLPIARDPRHPVLRVAHATEGQAAETFFSAVCNTTSEDSPVRIYRAEPKTGRTHQIRVHAASQGIPLFGDRFYSGGCASHLHLVSYEIVCAHPVTGEMLTHTLPQHLQPVWIQAALATR
jgi:tRNA pseudouridine32 synthase/23S rRNA pseudouridine746 synthase